MMNRDGIPCIQVDAHGGYLIVGVSPVQGVTRMRIRKDVRVPGERSNAEPPLWTA